MSSDNDDLRRYAGLSPKDDPTQLDHRASSGLAGEEELAAIERFQSQDLPAIRYIDEQSPMSKERLWQEVAMRIYVTQGTDLRLQGMSAEENLGSSWRAADLFVEGME